MVSRVSFRRFSDLKEIMRPKSIILVSLALTIAFSSLMPTQVMAIWPFDPPKRTATALSASKLDATKSQAIGDVPILADENIKPKTDRRIDKEDTDKRKAFYKTFTNKDGTKTLRYSSNQLNYKEGGKWLEINNNLSEKLLAQPKSLLDIITSSEPEPLSSDEFKGDAGVIKTEMRSLRDGIKMTFEGRALTVVPVGAKDVKPSKKDERTVAYKDAWPNVDLEYELRGEIVKEKIILKNKNAQTEFDFRIKGGELYEHPTRPGELAVKGVDPEQFSFSSLTLDVNGRGVISEERVTQVPTSIGLRATVDSDWLKQQSKDAFPMIVDPSFYRYNDRGEIRKSDGYGCNQTNCHFNTGTLNDNGWKHWRTYFTFDYAQAHGKNILAASLQMPMAGGIGGETGGRWLNMSWAHCLSFHCVGQGAVASSHVGTWANLDVTEVFRNPVNWSPSGAWFGIWGEEGPYKSYKPFYEMHIDVIYDSPTPVPTIIGPADGQVTVNTQPTLRINPVTDPDGPVQYSYIVSTNKGGGGAVINSGWTPATQWTVPDGILQDGTTYYWRVLAKDDHPYSRQVSTVERAIKVNLRTGKDSTQSYETVGPVGIDIATGNATTSISTHAMNSLGGSIGLTMDYNTQAKVKNGLIGKYWNVSSSHPGGVPSGQPQLVRNDQDVNFSWPNGASPGAGINQDWFFVQWTGYFIAPTTGTYQFGASRDDALSIKVNNVHFGGCYGGSPCYDNTSINLVAGQVVPIEVQFTEATGDGYARVYVKGAVPEQIVPRDWLRTEVQPSMARYGLQGRYYTDDGTRTFPSNPQDVDRLMMARIDPKLRFDWGTGGPAPGLRADNFLVKWTGYITVPTTGLYTFGTQGDDGVRVKLNNGFLGAQQTVHDAWYYTPDLVWGSATTLTAGQAVPISIEYYEQDNGAKFNLFVKDVNNVEQEIPINWLTPKASALPNAWQLGVNVDGSVGYERLRVAGQSIILEDSTRATHEYTWTGSGYKPPVNEDGNLTKNTNNTYTLIDTDGRTYIFDAEGKLTSLTTPSDDRSPASLKYEYAGDPSRLIKITDGVTSDRYGTLHYKGLNEDGNCSVSSGYSAAPDGMLCAFKTSDGKLTKLNYTNDQLSRVTLPGDELVDYGYDNLGRIISSRDSLANDSIAAGFRVDDSSVLTEINYDNLGRVASVKAPAASDGANRITHSFDYLVNKKQAKPYAAISGGLYPVAGTVVGVSWGGTRIDLFARGTGNDVIHKWSDDGVVWSTWGTLGGCIREKPTVASWKSGRLDIFAKNCNNSGNMISHKWFEGNWGGWGDVPSFTNVPVASAPSAVSWSDSRLDYVMRSADNKLWHGWWSPGSGWSAGGQIPGCISGNPSITSGTSGELDIYAAGCESSADKTISKITWRNNWSPLIDQSVTGTLVQASVSDDDSTSLAFNKSSGEAFAKYGNETIKLADCSSDAPALVATDAGNFAFFTPCGSSDVKQYLVSKSGASKVHVSGASEPSGFSKYIEYDNLLRTKKETDAANLTILTEWDNVKDLKLSSTDSTGLKSTSIYDSNDRAIEAYGPAPAAWYGSDRRPLSSYANQVPKTTSGYDEGIVGPAVTWYDYQARPDTSSTPGSGGALVGASRLYATGINSTQGILSADIASPAVSYGSHTGVGFRATGKLYLPNGTYWVNAQNTEGIRLSVDDNLVIDSWQDGANRSITGGSFTVTNGEAKRFYLETYRKNGSTGAFNLFIKQDLGFDWTNNWSQWLKPDYNLSTSETAYDAQIGNVTSTTTYSKPEYGLVDKATADPTGLNLQASSLFEAPGSGFLRQTNKTLPGGGTTSYQHYGATETRDNPCTVGVEAIHQGGLPKGKTEADPDGDGVQTARTSETVYNESGMIVATRYNTDPWTCISYDDRGRTISTIVPTISSMQGRTITNSYVVDNNPLKTSVNDGTGAIVTTIDLLGRTVSYTDAHGKTTTSAYDNLGRLITRNGPLGNESFVYDAVDKLIEQKLDGVTVAAPHYDQYGRITSVDYPTAGQQKLSSITRDSHGRTASLTYVLGDSSTAIDTVTYSQSGLVLTNSRTVGGNSLNSTYSYDKAARLTGATIGSNTYLYEFGSLDVSCGAGNGINPNAGKNSNRTKQTINGVFTTYCYDHADRLVSSSDQLVNSPEYDAHGNTTKIGSTSTPLTLQYDASDRNIGLEELNSSLTGKGVYYQRDALDRIIERKADTITAGSHSTNSLVKYGFTGGGDTPDVLLDNANNVKEKYVPLVGGVLLTLRPNETVETQKATHSLSNIHGDVFVTTDKSGNFTDATAYDPFGNKLPGVTTSPQNTESGSFDWLGGARKQTENGFALNVTQMGARVYVPALGRFLQADPVEGGTLNNYVYVVDPVNQNDLDGRIAFIPLIAAIVNVVRVVIPIVVTAIAAKVVSKVVTKTGSQAGSQVAKGTASQAAKGSSSRASSNVKPGSAPTPKATLENKASTRQALTLKEDLFLRQVQSHGSQLPGARPIMEGRIKDPNFPYPWRKYEYVQRLSDSSQLNAHWFEHPITGEIRQLKLK